ncbi:MAG: Holliday junction branch migration protein RuvA [Bdellovibrionaceae bacterium]|nr:Holliday junction branch migration protein RuvA [Pseudobdellovibrionaceae bacterium]|tara:strand:+ start:1378 stop:2019 length:642 start_codon:yes stop_codon:yes gene_type:complete
MIGFLCGKVVNHSENEMIVGVGNDQSYVGYLVWVPQGSAYQMLHPGMEIKLRIHTHVREDSFELFGFLTQEEKLFFKMLTGVSGIGPKGALTVLSFASLPEIIESILSADKAWITQISGIGKKTAERVILELKEPLQKLRETGVFIWGGHSQNQKKVSPVGKSTSVQDAKTALVGLGYRELDAEQLLQEVASHESTDGFEVEDWIKAALQKMS